MLSCYVVIFALIGFAFSATQIEPQKPFRTNCQEIERVFGVMNGIDQNEIVKSIPIVQEIKEKLENLPTKVEEEQIAALNDFDAEVSQLEKNFDKEEEATKQRLNSGAELPEGKKICVTEIRSSLHKLRNSYSLLGCYSEENRLQALAKTTELGSTLETVHARIVEYRKQLEKGCQECCNDGDIVAEIETFLRRGPNVNEDLRTIGGLVNFGALDKCIQLTSQRREKEMEHMRLFHLCCLA